MALCIACVHMCWARNGSAIIEELLNSVCPIETQLTKLDCSRQLPHSMQNCRAVLHVFIFLNANPRLA